MPTVIMEVTAVVTHKKEVELEGQELKEVIDSFEEDLEKGESFFSEAVGDWMGPGTEYDGEWRDATVLVIENDKVIETLE